ncbi:MAG: hypothetical protein K0Q87_928 [Neobacillus sp.]|nr:hypothetical protein [Neobacillus sp.]
MKIWAVAITAALLLLSGCSDKKEVAKPEKEAEEVDKEVVVEGDLKPYSFPLTGIASETETEGRAIAVTINNHPKARPQSGLNKADIVYEVLAEGDITRFVAIFQSEKPKNIGPIRSARPYYLELAKGFDALYIAHGYSAQAEELLTKGYIDELNGMAYDGTLFKRASYRVAPHNSYITYENILKGAEERNYSMEQTPPSFKFWTAEEGKNLVADDAHSIMVSYSSSSISDSTYEYDVKLGKYKRFSGGEQTIDYETKEPILLDNLFIIETNHEVVNDVGHKEIDLLSGGNGYLLQMGKVIEVEWENQDGIIVPVKNGEVVPLIQGKTWVNVVPTNPGLQNSISFKVN